ncbi:hypothetical protein ACGFNU_29455 [Spirillospora sp. NPDC048911]|uniref:hypothetical protein n=1 Tax=Spirillospora sp. NPDC048911 TaxID=3364527 RepID=UPI003716C0D3
MKAWMRSFGIIAVSGVLLSGAACGGDDGGTSDSATPPGTSAAASPTPATSAGGGVPTTAAAAERRAAEAKRKLTECLRKAGLGGLPSPGASLSPKEQESAQKCAAQMLMGSDPTVRAKVEALRTCMKKRGATVPAAGEPFIPKVDDPKVAAALRACQQSGTG